jgi:pilus assembly protein CpaF
MIPERIYEQSILRHFEPIRPFLEDESVGEIMINGADEIWIEADGGLQKTDAEFESRQKLMSGAKNIAQYVGKPLDTLNPRLDARLPDGSRVHIVLDDCSHEGVTICIRQFGEETITIEDLINWDSVTPVGAKFLQRCVKLERNIVVAGGTGSGKTTLLNVLSSFIGDDERIIVIEDSTELQFNQPHVVRLEARKADKKGRGEVSIADLFHSAMRLRPDRVVIGEIRGEESMTMLQAMTSGHGGSLTTTHATYPDDTLRRLETMAMMSDVEIPLNPLRRQVASAVELIVQQSRFNDGSRKITHIVEVLDLDEEGNYQIYPLFRFNHQGRNSEGKILGQLEPCGNIPTFMDLAESKDLPLEESWFKPS